VVGSCEEGNDASNIHKLIDYSSIAELLIEFEEGLRSKLLAT
jgi:hypothetical protein